MSSEVITLITQRTSASNTFSDIIKDKLGDDNGTGVFRNSYRGLTCSPDSLVLGAHLFVLPKKSVIDCM